MKATHHVQLQTQEDQENQPGITQPIPRAKGKRVYATYVLGLVGMLVVYLAGLFSHPLLFGTGTDASRGNRNVQTATPSGGGLAREAETQRLPVAQAYEVLAQEMRNLSSAECAPAELGAKLDAIEWQVEQLRVLNPYYHFKEIQAVVIPTGVPDTYGAALNVSFDQVQASIDVMRQFDPTYGEDRIVLTSTDLERYVRVGSGTACRYCCDARTLVEPNGDAACGCGHSQAMRGLAAYLLINHAGDYSDEELVEELKRWRAVYFPKQTLTEALVELRDAGEPGIEEIEQEFPEFMPQMVGRC